MGQVFFGVVIKALMAVFSCALYKLSFCFYFAEKGELTSAQMKTGFKIDLIVFVVESVEVENRLVKLLFQSRAENKITSLYQQLKVLFKMSGHCFEL